MIEFRDANDASRESIRKRELEELEKDRKTIEDSRSQARIAWDQHEQVSNELATVRGELEKAQAVLQEESRKAMLQRREVNNTLIQLPNEAHRVARALGELGVPSLPIITEDHAQYLHCYPLLLKRITQLIGGIQSQTKKVTRKVGEAAVRQTQTHVVSALQHRHPTLSLQSELDAVDPAALSPPGVSDQVDKILESLSREG